MIGYDFLAVRSIRHPLALGRIALASFTGFATSYNFGALLGGTSVRYRLYSVWGLSAVDIVRLVVMLGLTFWFGVFGLAGVLFLVDPFPIPAGLALPVATVRPLGWGLLALTIGYLGLTVFWKKPIRLRGTEVSLPGPGISSLQLAIAAADLIVAAGILYVLLPADFGLDYFEFLGIYLLAVVAVILTHVPGGVGVFELMVLKLAGAQSNERLIAALLVFRAIYYLLPLLISAVLLAGHELMLRRRATERLLAGLYGAASAAAPSLLAYATFAAGAILLFSGALPVLPSRLGQLELTIPLPLMELSHFAASLAGTGLLLTARGLQRRLLSAWQMSIALLAVGIAGSLLKGFDYEEAVVLGVVLARVGQLSAGILPPGLIGPPAVHLRLDDGRGLGGPGFRVAGIVRLPAHRGLGRYVEPLLVASRRAAIPASERRRGGDVAADRRPADRPPPALGSGVGARSGPGGGGNDRPHLAAELPSIWHCLAISRFSSANSVPAL